MDFSKNLLDLSSGNQKMHGIYDFVDEIHKLIECSKSDCEILHFLKPLEVVFSNEKKKPRETERIFCLALHKEPERCQFNISVEK